MKLQKIFSIPLCLCAFIAVLSCSARKDGPADAVLDSAFSLMEARPDSALAVLESIPEESLGSRRLLARRSLLLAMARDKNYIDDTTDSIIAPAVAWYRRHGTADERLLMNYYRGIVELNRGNYDEAMKWFLNAERYQRGSKNALHSARIHSAKSSLYDDMYNSEATIREEKAASALFLEAGDSSRYFNSVLSLAAEYNKKKDSASVAGYMAILEKGWNKLSENQKSLYYSGMLIHLSYFGKDKVDNVLRLYLDDIEDPSLIRWEIVAYTNYLVGKYEPAFEAISRYLDYDGEKDLAYLWINGLISESLGYYPAAADSFHKFINADGNKDFGLFNSDAKFIEERTSSNEKINELSYTLLLMLSVVILLALCLYLLYGRHVSQNKLLLSEQRARKAESELYEAERSRYEDLCAELRLQQQILEKTLESVDLDKNVREAIDEQLSALNEFLVLNITDMPCKDAVARLASLVNDQKHFLSLLSASYKIRYPKFIAYLVSSGMNDREVGCCCLHCLGLNCSEVSAYLKQPSYRNQITEMRKKLEMGKRGTNFDIFLRQKLAELS